MLLSGRSLVETPGASMAALKIPRSCRVVFRGSQGLLINKEIKLMDVMGEKDRGKRQQDMRRGKSPWALKRVTTGLVKQKGQALGSRDRPLWQHAVFVFEYDLRRYVKEVWINHR